MNPCLLKIKNDIDEGLWDLLLVHTWEEPKSIPKDSPYAKEFTDLLRSAIRTLDRQCDRQRNKSDFKVAFLRNKFRTILILANRILRYENDQDIKDLKRRIIEEYTNSSPSDAELIPLRYQITELRITYDARYLGYLIKKLLDQQEYDKALYCLLTYKLIEPDHPKIESWRAQIRSWVSEPELPAYTPAEPADLVLLDSNAIFPEVFQDAAGYVFGMEPIRIPEGAKITPSVLSEVHSAWDYHLSRAETIGIDTDALKSAIEPRFEALNERLIDVEPASLEPIRAMYGEYLFALEGILYRKMVHMNRMSDKLEKLSHRDTLLPEDGDLNLLAEAITLSKDRTVAILSRDEDFWAFQGPIRGRFGIEIRKA